MTSGVPWQIEARERTATRDLYAFGITAFFNDTATEIAYWVLPAFLTSIGAGPAQLGLIEDEAYAEIAQALGISAGVARTRMFRAVRLLRKKLQRLGVHP